MSEGRLKPRKLSFEGGEGMAKGVRPSQEEGSDQQNQNYEAEPPHLSNPFLRRKQAEG